MAKKNKRFRVKASSHDAVVGEMPGSVTISKDALKPIIEIYSYNQAEVKEDKGTNISVVLDQMKACDQHTHWILIKGLGDQDLIEAIGSKLEINSLVLEDIVHTRQRPKFDEYDKYVFMTSRLLHYHKEEAIEDYQLSILVKENIVISFQETHEEYFEGVKKRLAAGKGFIRTAGPGYLAYALTDTVIDRYFDLLNKVGDSLDLLEDRLYQNPDRSIMYESQQLKRGMILLRRAVWPERDKINDMIRTESPLLTQTDKLYLRDAYDHCIQVIDLIESYKEVTASILDMYLSIISNRMNEIMKVLTIISSIFIPLTFIAGIYGMNFARLDPVTNKVMPDNLPELYQPHGYIYTLIVMLIIAVIQFVFFWRKGWFNKM
ncbi:magnesium/cobalt transporter CorA [Mucilaginibacter arboris]|uniref:Magnesium transport protein CorA n=1 Tax=Mucilaginibacter arboris TaxID=2682090 RepID=A0A7K1SY11_9SPHI|nr:magnesium/cobalt transporter CorA [Mucilaginibacter arboris]MVN22137.1 magnesium/cobalt transporter CorA [Mucilaginibacter arboris]